MLRTTFKAALAGAILSLAFAAGTAQAAPVSPDATRSAASQSASEATPVHWRRHHRHRWHHHRSHRHHWHRRHYHRHCGYVRRCGYWGCRIVRRCHRGW
jgi:hypothetical protein